MKKFFKKYKYELFIFLIFVLTRLPGLGFDNFNTDVWKWKARSYDFGQGVFTLDFEKTIQKYHPGVTLMWVGVLGIKIFNFFTENFFKDLKPIDQVFWLDFVQKLLLVLLMGLILAIALYPIRKMFKVRFWLFFFLTLNFEIYFLALTRVFHLEGLMTMFVLASITWSYYAFNDNAFKLKPYLFSSFCISLAGLTKTSSLIFLPIILLFGLPFSEKVTGSLLKSITIPRFKFLSAFVFTYILFWPAMWTHPLKALSALNRGVMDIGIERDHIQLFMGKIVDDPGIIFYPVVFVAKISPFFILTFFGYIFTRNRTSHEKRRFLHYALLAAVFYGLIMSLPSKKLDRYILSVIVLLISYCAAFLENFFKKLSMSRALAIFVIPITTALYIHPDYFSYYSPLVGGMKKGIYLIEPKWLFGQSEIEKFFSTSPFVVGFKKFEPEESFEQLLYKKELREKLTVGFAEKNYTQMWPFIKKIGGVPTVMNIDGFAIRTNFFVYPVWDDYSFEEDRFKIKYIDSIYVRGVPIYNVYQRVYDD